MAISCSRIGCLLNGAQEARNRIVAFHNAYVRCLEARAAANLAEAQRLQMEMADSSIAVQRDLDRVDLGTITLIDAPAAGGRRWPTPLVHVVLTGLADQYNIDPSMVQVMLRQAAGEYERLALEPSSAVAFRRLGRGLRFTLLSPVRVFVTALRILRQHLIAVSVVAGTIASLLYILKTLGVL